MANSEDILALYGAIRKLAESMEQREAALDEKTEAFNAAITTLQQLPYKLGQQTGQYLSMGCGNPWSRTSSFPSMNW